MNMNSKRERRIKALQNLADRPGTEAEGLVAKQRLKEILAKDNSASLTEADNPFHANGYLNFVLSMLRVNHQAQTFNDPLFYGSTVGQGRSTQVPKDFIKCPCGSLFSGKAHLDVHKHLRKKVQEMFPIGSTVFYGHSQYSYLSPGDKIVTNYDINNGWNSVMLTINKQCFIVPIFEDGKCCLFKPVV